MQPVEGKGMEGVLSEGDWNGNGMGVEGERQGLRWNRRTAAWTPLLRPIPIPINFGFGFCFFEVPNLNANEIHLTTTPTYFVHVHVLRSHTATALSVCVEFDNVCVCTIRHRSVHVFSCMLSFRTYISKLAYNT